MFAICCWFSVGSVDPFFQACLSPVPSIMLACRLSTVKAAGEEPVPLLREMTPQEVQAKSQKTKVSVAMPKTLCGASAALSVRDQMFEARGEETLASKKRRKKEESASDRAAAMKLVKGGHLLK